MALKLTPTNKILIGILLIAFLFRFYNLQGFQFWFSDEEVNAMVVRKMVVEKRPVFISPNSTTGLTLGPFFHWLSVPIFYVSNLNPEIILAAMGFLGILTSYIVFLIGKSAGNPKIGLVSSFLYASSFVMGLYDRRWWTLSISPILAAIAIYSIFQIKTFHKYLWSIPLAICISFSFHADPTIGVITIATLLTFLVLRIPILRKEYLYALLAIVIFLAPLLLFEIKHPKSVTNPILASLRKNTPPTGGFGQIINDLSQKTLITFSNVTVPKPTKFAEIYISSGFSGRHNLFGSIFFPIILILVLFPIFKFSSLSKKERAFVSLLYCYLAAFLAGIFLYSVFYKKPIWQHYFTIVLPAFFLLAGFTLAKALKNQILLVALLTIFFLVNFYTLLNSSFKYPLFEKRKLVSDLSQKLSDSSFSLYQKGDAYFIGGGFPILFIFENKHPKRSNVYDYYDWMYKAHSLYTIAPSTEDQDKVVIISKDLINKYPDSKILYRDKVGQMYSIILDNRDKWYKE